MRNWGLASDGGSRSVIVRWAVIAARRVWYCRRVLRVCYRLEGITTNVVVAWPEISIVVDLWRKSGITHANEWWRGIVFQTIIEIFCVNEVTGHFFSSPSLDRIWIDAFSSVEINQRIGYIVLNNITIESAILNQSGLSDLITKKDPISTYSCDPSRRGTSRIMHGVAYDSAIRRVVHCNAVVVFFNEHEVVLDGHIVQGHVKGSWRKYLLE